VPSTPAARLRRWILAALLVGLVGTAAELLLLEHYEDPWQVVPLALIGAALAALSWSLISRRPAAVRSLQTAMALCLVSGLTGVWLHYQGAAAFQLEIDPSQAGWPLFEKAIYAKAPPVLAPGMMVQLGLLGLAYSYCRHDEPRDRRKE
jgi:NO-binding membrane sensor protein with MHYT domain